MYQFGLAFASSAFSSLVFCVLFALIVLRVVSEADTLLVAGLALQGCALQVEAALLCVV